MPGAATTGSTMRLARRMASMEKLRRASSRRTAAALPRSTTHRTTFPFTPIYPCRLPTCAWGRRRTSLADTITRGRPGLSMWRIITSHPVRSSGHGATTNSGYAWDRSLTDADGPYVELMAGVYTDNQPDFSFLGPGETKSWSQFWYPIQKIGPAQQANIDAAMSLRVKGHCATAGVSVSSAFRGAKITLLAAGKPIETFMRDLAPGSAFLWKRSRFRRMSRRPICSCAWRIGKGAN